MSNENRYLTDLSHNRMLHHSSLDETGRIGLPQAGFTHVRIGCRFPCTQFAQHASATSSMERVYTFSRLSQSEFQKCPRCVCFRFRYEFGQKFGPDLHLNRWTGMHWTPYWELRPHMWTRPQGRLSSSTRVKWKQQVKCVLGWGLESEIWESDYSPMQETHWSELCLGL